MPAGGRTPGWLCCQIRQARSTIAWWAQKIGSYAAQSTWPIVPATQTCTLLWISEMRRSNSVKLGARWAQSQRSFHGGGRASGRLPTARVVFRGQDGSRLPVIGSIGTEKRGFARPPKRRRAYGRGVASEVP